MKYLYKLFVFVGIMLSLLSVLIGCSYGRGVLVEETYKYTTKSKNYVQPAAVDGWVEKVALITDTKDGKFYCFTDDKSAADDFINSQRTLMKYLRKCGVEIGEVESYGTDYGYSFSESNENAVYVALSDMRTWQQVLVTLQTVWGDYTDYGYVYAISNAIAGELEWQTDSVPAFDSAAMDSFFAENPDVINMLYPTFTTKFASEEAVNNSKALAVHLFENIDWKKSLEKTAVEQLDDYYELVSAYAQMLSVPFDRQTCGYAYYGENVKLRIMTTYAELIIDGNYRDVQENIYGEYWNDYLSVYETTNTINEEITTAVESFNLDDKAGIVQMKWLDSENDMSNKYLKGVRGRYYDSTNTVYLVSIWPYLHEYYHHIEHILNPNLGAVWQEQAFCELGASYSKYSLIAGENMFATPELGSELYQAFTGNSYQPIRDAYFEGFDILCYAYDYYQLEYTTGAESMNSICRYLVDLYGEKEVYNLLLFPETVVESTGKTWEELQAEWQQYIKDKYSDVVISAEISSKLELSE